MSSFSLSSEIGIPRLPGDPYNPSSPPPKSRLWSCSFEVSPSAAQVLHVIRVVRICFEPIHVGGNNNFSTGTRARCADRNGWREGDRGGEMLLMPCDPDSARRGGGARTKRKDDAGCAKRRPHRIECIIIIIKTTVCLSSTQKKFLGQSFVDYLGPTYFDQMQLL